MQVGAGLRQAAGGKAQAMDEVVFVSHPEVEVDPGRPVPQWSLSPAGRTRMHAFAASPAVEGVKSIHASTEVKAVESAIILADRLDLSVHRLGALGENDRSATGFVPPAKFEELANRFFAKPDESVMGWERAVDAQTRIRMAVDSLLASAPAGHVAIIAHGGVGTLLLCHHLGVRISRDYDQPFQGHFWRFRRRDREVLHKWQPIAPR
jgi:broad specificity phosphatase PhoE